MKTIKYIFVSVIACLLTIGCSLDEKNYSNVEKDQFMRNAKEAESVLLGVYRNLMKDDLYSQNLSMIFTLPTDQAKIEGTGTDNHYRAVGNCSFEPTLDIIEDTWASLYRGIYDANDFLEKIAVKMQNFTEEDQKLAEVYIGEAKTLRALFYFELVRWYGHVALIKTTDESYKHPSTFTQADPKDVYAFIEQDLKEAAEVLPMATVNTMYRLSKGSALGLLTKVYATWAGEPVNDETKWQLAAETAKKLINDPENIHTLLPDYKDLWVNSANNIWDPRESLIEVSFYSPAMTGQAAYDPSGRIGKFNGVVAERYAFASNSQKIESKWRIHPIFLSEWKDREIDKRWEISFCPIKKYKANGVVEHYAMSGKGESAVPITFETSIAENKSRDKFLNTMCPGKWNIPALSNLNNVLEDKNYSNVNWYILRYADVLLLYAEAINEYNGGPDDKAYEAINNVRTRAGLPALSGLDQNSFREALRTERSHELAFEGHRKQDLVRWGIYVETVVRTRQNLGKLWDIDNGPDSFSGGLNIQKGKHEILPIPKREMDLMPQFIQNDGWGE